MTAAYSGRRSLIAAFWGRFPHYRRVNTTRYLTRVSTSRQAWQGRREPTRVLAEKGCEIGLSAYVQCLEQFELGVRTSLLRVQLRLERVSRSRTPSPLGRAHACGN